MSFKFSPKTQMYKASNNLLRLDPLEAVSYDWWVYVKFIDGLVIFNDFAYSNTTRRHQHKMKNLLAELGIEIDIFVTSKSSLKNWSLADIINNLKTNMEELETIMKGKRKGTIVYGSLLGRFNKYHDGFRRISYV